MNNTQSPDSTKRPIVLIVCDGWGEIPETEGNAIAQAKTPNMDSFYEKWPHTTVAASGEAVGLPAGQQGNSEVGHLTIGSGRVIRQPLSRQIYEIESGNFYKNQVLIDAVELAKQRGSALHIMGLLSPGGVHSTSDSGLALVRLAKEHGLEEVNVHAFTDGRDTPPTSALEYISAFESELNTIGTGRIASVAGRFYAMDRDKRWDRIQEAYDMLTADTFKTAPSATEYIKENYENNVTDEFLKPVSITDKNGSRARIEDGDVVIFYNFRPDRAREISHALIDADFSEFERGRVVKDLHLVAFAEYDSTLDTPIAFPADNAANSLAEVASAHGLKQYHIAETEKYAHVTYFMNGGREEPFDNEDRAMIPSRKDVATYDLAPDMSAREITEEVITQIKSDTYDLIIMNFANADMLGHTGMLDKAIQAVETLDECLGKVINATLQQGGIALMTADHGNAEYEIDYESGSPITSHTANPVPVLLCGSSVTSLRKGGGLGDIAPTILTLMRINTPAEMTGKSLAE